MSNPQHVPPVNDDAIDIAHQKLRLDSDVVIWPGWENGKRVYRLEHAGSKRYFRLGMREYTFTSLLDGNTTVAAACGLAASHLGAKALSANEVESVVVWLLNEEIATLSSDRATRRRAIDRERTGKDSKGLLQRLNPFWIQIPLIKNVRRIEGFFELTARCLHPAMILFGGALILVGLVLFGLHHESVYRSTGNLFSRTGWIYLVGTWVVLKIIHEAGHAIACHRYGGDTGEIGIVLILFAPLAYVDVSSCWRMPRRISRLCVSAAGMFVELVVASVAMTVWCFSDDVTTQFWTANIVVTAGVSTLLFNANPLMRFDGYYLLSDAVQIPNLYGEGTAEIQRVARQVFYGDAIASSHYSGWRRAFVMCYGTAAAIWRLFICLALCLSASVMFSGAGIVIAVMGVFTWFGRPALSLVSQGIENWQVNRIRFMRSVVVGMMLVAATMFLILTPVPTGVVVPGVVQDPSESIVRTQANGFVREIHVVDGQKVAVGDPLITLENGELVEEVRQLELALEENAVQKRIATDQHATSAEQIAANDRVALQRQLAQIRPKAIQLTIQAPHDGTVRARDLNTMVGRFVDEGDEVIRVISLAQSEVIGVIHQDYISVARQHVGSGLTLADASLRTFPGELKSVDPRASRTLPDRSLAAPLGGPIDVVEEENVGREAGSAIKLVEPHFTLRVDLASDSARSWGKSPYTDDVLPSGMRVEIRIGQRYESIWHRSKRAVRRLWQTVVDQADAS